MNRAISRRFGSFLYVNGLSYDSHIIIDRCSFHKDRRRLAGMKAQSRTTTSWLMPQASIQLPCRATSSLQVHSRLRLSGLPTLTSLFSTQSSWHDDIISMLDQGLVQEAQTMYDQTSTKCPTGSIDTEITHPQELRMQVQIRLFDSWISHQQDTLDAFHLGLRQHTPSTSSVTPVLSSDQDRQLKTIVYAAKMAHNLLEQMEPFLGARNVLLSQRSRPVDIDGKESDAHLTAGGPPVAARNDKLSSGTVHSKREVDLVATQRCDDVLTAWAKAVRAVHKADASRSLIRAIPQRAQFLLERTEASSDPRSGDAVMVQPSVHSYNRVIEAWAYSREHLRGASAERLFQKITLDKAGTPVAAKAVRPDTETYRLMVWAWAQSRDQRAAFTATGYLMKMLRRLEVGTEQDNNYSGNHRMEPTIDDYHVVFRAWSRSEEKASPGKAYSLLKLTTAMYKKGLTMTQPDELCCRLVLQTAAQRPALPDLGPLVVDTTLAQMRENFMVPDSKCYSAAIRTWKNAALYQPDVSAADQQTSVRRVLELLAEMKLAHNQSTSVSVTVSTTNVNDVLEALSVSTDRRRLEQAEELLANLERGWLDIKSQLTPNVESYRHAMNVWRSHDSVDKVTASKEILLRALQNRDKILGGNDRKGQLVGLFNAFVGVCGASKARTELEGQTVLKEALAAIQMMRALDNLEPNPETYSTLLEACAKLLPQGRERRVAVETIFKLCCEDGMVDEDVLALLRKTAPADLFSDIVLTSSENVEGTKVIPEAWTRKALGGKVVSADGRKTTPLSVDGRLKITMAMKEFKMRRLRDKRNQKLLRGGRLNTPKEPETSPWRLYNSS